MLFIGLTILVLAMSMSFSVLAQGRRRALPGGGRQRDTPVTSTSPYGFTRLPRGLPTDVPLSRSSHDAIDSDLTTFSTELRELDFDVEDFQLTGAARTDYTLALGAHDKARRALRSARSDAEATQITHLLEEGRHAVARLRSRALGQPLPSRRPPCFFDPAHGPSVGDVVWSPPGGLERGVPACVVDVARTGLGAEPLVRMVGAGGSRVPYWEDRSLAAWAQGYFGPWMNEPSMRSLTRGTTMVRGFSRLMGLLDD